MVDEVVGFALEVGTDFGGAAKDLVSFFEDFGTNDFANVADLFGQVTGFILQAGPRFGGGVEARVGGIGGGSAYVTLPLAELDGINEAPTHRIAIMGSRSGTPFTRSPDRCYSDDPAWELLATIEITKSLRPSFVNRSTSFIANARYRHLAIASDCCQDGEDTRPENLTYWAIDDVSLKAANLNPVDAEIALLPRDCDQDVLLCAETPSGVWDYQWYQNSTAIVGATRQCLPVPIDSAPGQTFSLWVTSSDNCRVVSITIPDIPDCGPQPEDCTNGLDDDGDGLIDEADDDCDCLNTDFDLRITASPAVIELGGRSRLQLTTSVPSPLISWSPAEGLSCSDCPSPIAQPVRSEVYTASVTDAESGCSDQDSIRITLLPGRALYRPNAVSPNADGINDFWRALPGPAVENLRDLQVFDRWGNLVFDSPTAEAWDGRERPAGNYVFLLLARFIDGHEEWIRGNILLVR